MKFIIFYFSLLEETDNIPQTSEYQFQNNNMDFMYGLYILTPRRNDVKLKFY